MKHSIISLRDVDKQVAAQCFAEGFIDDPAFALILQGQKNGKSLLYKYFLNYITGCKELLLYNHTAGGYLCIYRYDTHFADFDVPEALGALEQFQCIDRYYDTEYAVLDILAVESAARGRGIAGELVDFFVRFCREQNLVGLVEVFTDQHLSLYESRGFTVAHRHTCRNITTYILELKRYDRNT